jgi:hypothetical protein
LILRQRASVSKLPLNEVSQVLAGTDVSGLGACVDLVGVVFWEHQEQIFSTGERDSEKGLSGNAHLFWGKLAHRIKDPARWSQVRLADE